jgi:predicted component of type VI protein secretion system
MGTVAVRLIIEDLEGATTVVNLGTEEVTIGRKPHNTIQLTEQNVSRSHAKLTFRDDGWLIQDLGSYNGVKVNGVPIGGATVLRESDLIQIGDYHLTLTDDVDRETVDIERPRVAANDGMMGGAAASSELPSVSVDDLSPMRAPNMAPGDSAPYRTTQAPLREEKKGQAGLIIGIIGSLLAVVAIAILVTQSGKNDDEKPAGKDETEIAGKGDPTPDPQPDPLPETTTAPVDTGAVPADTGMVAEDGGPGEEAGLAADAGEVVETDGGSPTDEGEVVETDSGEEPEISPPPEKPDQPKQPKPDTPKLPPDQALAEARKASLTGNNKKAYSLAKDAYDQNKSSEALSVMGVAACKMGSESKAKAAYKKMTVAKDKQTLEKVCAPLGINLN